MILEKDYVEVQSHGFQSTKTAEIKATPAMLRMLSSGIYSDKISAFIRELSTNAYDAMVEAGTIKDQTFDVHLPTKLEPWYSIRDYGTGLSTAGMENNFSNFGDGTKAESNVYNGAFGLGSKSPLSYTRDFTIVSYYKGQKTFYNYGLNDENIPVLSTAFTQPSDEPSGLEIQIAINNPDIEEVQRKAELIYRYFDKRPNTNIKIDYHELPRLVEGDGWFLTKPDIRKNSYGSGYEVTTPTRVIMGNVIYPITNSGLSSYSTIYPMTQIPFVIKVEIGSVQMTPSRETLEMTPKTIKFLEDKLKEIMGELSNNLEQKLDKTLCVFEKVISAYDLLKLMPSGINSCQIDKFRVSSRRYEDIFTFPDKFHNVCKFKRFTQDSSYEYRKTEDYINKMWRPLNNLNYMFLIVDSNKRIGTILEKLKGKYHTVYVVRPQDTSTYKTEKTLKDFKDASKKFLESCGNPKHLYASVEEAKLPPIVKAKPQPKVAGAVPVPRAKGIIKIRPITISNSHASIGNEKSVAGTDTGAYYYVYSFRGELQDTDNKTDYQLRYCVHRFIQDLEEKLKKPINACVITGTYIDRVKKDSRFINLLEEVKSHNFVVEVSNNYKAVREVTDKYYFDSNVREVLQKLQGTKISEIFKMHENTRVDNTRTYKDTFIKHNYTFKEVNPIDLTEHAKELEKYKDLQGLNYKASKTFIKDIMDMIDNKTDIIKTKG